MILIIWLYFCCFIIGKVCLIVINGVICIIWISSLNFLVGKFLMGEMCCIFVLLINICNELKWLIVWEIVVVIFFLDVMLYFKLIVWKFLFCNCLVVFFVCFLSWLVIIIFVFFFVKVFFIL